MRRCCMMKTVFLFSHCLQELVLCTTNKELVLGDRSEIWVVFWGKIIWLRQLKYSYLYICSRKFHKDSQGTRGRKLHFFCARRRQCGDTGVSQWLAKKVVLLDRWLKDMFQDQFLETLVVSLC